MDRLWFVRVGRRAGLACDPVHQENLAPGYTWHPISHLTRRAGHAAAQAIRGSRNLPAPAPCSPPQSPPVSLTTRQHLDAGTPLSTQCNKNGRTRGSGRSSVLRLKPTSERLSPFAVNLSDDWLSDDIAGCEWSAGRQDRIQRSMPATRETLRWSACSAGMPRRG